MISRRGILKGLLGVTLASLLAVIYAVLGEPVLRLRVQRWALRPPRWTGGRLSIAVVSDLHMGEPFVGIARLRRIVARVNALEPDLIVVLGDLVAGHRFITGKVNVADTAAVLAGLAAPLGVFGVLGNHDWWDDPAAQQRGGGPVQAGLAMQANGIPVLENQAVKLGGFWLAGLGDQWALRRGGGRFAGVDDLDATLAQVTDDAPVILLAHEPDVFARIPDRVALQLSGHTHGGQIRLFGWSPVVPSRYGNRYAYGALREGGCDLVVSGGIGCSVLPVRIGSPPEITVVDLA